MNYEKVLIQIGVKVHFQYFAFQSLLNLEFSEIELSCPKSEFCAIHNSTFLIHNLTTFNLLLLDLH